MGEPSREANEWVNRWTDELTNEQTNEFKDASIFGNDWPAQPVSSEGHNCDQFVQKLVKLQVMY